MCGPQASPGPSAPRGPADLRRALAFCSAPAVVRHAEGVAAVGDLEVAVGAVAVADEPQAVGADGDRGVVADAARAVERRQRCRAAGGVAAVGYLEVGAGGVEVADEPQAVGADGDRGVPAD